MNESQGSYSKGANPFVHNYPAVCYKMRMATIENDKVVHKNGIQYLFEFPSSLFKASVVRHIYSYGHNENLWEFEFITIENNSDSNAEPYDQVADVFGSLTVKQVALFLYILINIDKKYSGAYDNSQVSTLLIQLHEAILGVMS